MYILKNRGLKAANGTVSDIPQEVIEFVSGTTFPSDKVRSEYIRKVLEAGVLPYTEVDYIEFRETAQFLNKYHHFMENEVSVEEDRKDSWIQKLKSIF